MYPSQDISRMGTARVKEEVGADKRIIAKEFMKYRMKEREHEGEKSQTRPN